MTAGFFIMQVLTAIWACITFDPSTVVAIIYSPQGLAVSFTVAILAGISMILGQLVVLAINQMRGMKLVFALGVSCLTLIFQAFLQGLVLWGFGRIFLPDLPNLTFVVEVILMSAAPMLLGFLILFPILGPPFGYLLSAWSLAIMWGLVAHVLDINRWYALILTLGTWLVAETITRYLGKPLGRLRDWIWLKMTGKPLLLSSQAVVDAYLYSTAKKVGDK